MIDDAAQDGGEEHCPPPRRSLRDLGSQGLYRGVAIGKGGNAVMLGGLLWSVIDSEITVSLATPPPDENDSNAGADSGGSGGADGSNRGNGPAITAPAVQRRVSAMALVDTASPLCTITRAEADRLLLPRGEEDGTVWVAITLAPADPVVCKAVVLPRGGRPGPGAVAVTLGNNFLCTGRYLVRPLDPSVRSRSRSNGGRCQNISTRVVRPRASSPRCALCACACSRRANV